MAEKTIAELAQEFLESAEGEKFELASPVRRGLLLLAGELPDVERIPDDWEVITETRIEDSDGWSLPGNSRPWGDKISRDEFEMRAGHSTVTRRVQR